MNLASTNQVTSGLSGTYNNVTTQVDDDETMGKESFLKLLITQMQNQDPLNPMEGIEFTQQLAQFSSLEQLMSMNDGLAGLQTTLQSMNNFDAISLVGEEVKALGNSLDVNDGVSTSGTFVLETQAANVTAYVKDQDGNYLRTLDLGPMAQGEHTLEWDGLDSNGNKVEDDTYLFDIAPVDEDNETINYMTSIQGKVESVTFDESGNAQLVVNGQMVSLDQILEIINTPVADDEEQTQEETEA